MRLPRQRGPAAGNPTRRSLISRLRRWDDHASWQEFFDTYWKLVYSVAIQAGLTEAEAQDVVQETVLSIAKKMPEFRYDPAVCSFKGWLLHVTRLRIKDQLRKRLPGGIPTSPGASETDAIARLPDGRRDPLESLWDREWKRNLMDVAMARVRRQVRPDHYQIFYLTAVQELGPAKVASMLGVSVAQVYLAKHRIAALIKKEVRRLERDGTVTAGPSQARA